MKKKLIIEIFAGIIIILIIALLVAKKEKLPVPAIPGTQSTATPQEFDYKKIIESLTPPVSIPNTIPPSPKILKSLSAPREINNINKQELEKILQSLTPR